MFIILFSLFFQQQSSPSSRTMYMAVPRIESHTPSWSSTAGAHIPQTGAKVPSTSGHMSVISPNQQQVGHLSNTASSTPAHLKSSQRSHMTATSLSSPIHVGSKSFVSSSHTMPSLSSGNTRTVVSVPQVS